VRDSIEGKGEVDWSDDPIALTLGELVAIFFVARDAMSPVSLRIYLFVSASGVDRARTLPEACFRLSQVGAVSFRVPFRFRVNYVSENTSAHNAHQPPTDNTRTDADLLRARHFTGIMDKEMQRGKEREGKTHRTLYASALATPTCT
jgi:hypothetical protein